MDMYAQAKAAKSVLRAFKQVNNDIKHYLWMKTTADIDRNKLAKVIRRLRAERLSILKTAKDMFPNTNYLLQYNG